MRLLFFVALCVAAWMIEPTGIVAQEIGPWREIEPMVQRRWEPGKVVYDDKLYLFGGYDNRPQGAAGRGPWTIKDCDIFDPTDRSWTPFRELPSAITHFNAVLDGDSVWFAGGFKEGYKGHCIREVWHYEMKKDSYEIAPLLPEKRGGGGLALVGRKLHYIGGVKEDRDTDSENHWVLDLENIDAGWIDAAPMPDPRNQFSCLAVDSKIYCIAGQYHHDSVQLDQWRVDIYDPKTDSWIRGPDLPHGHSHAEASTLLHRGRILVIGGHATPQGGRKRIDDDILMLKPGGQWEVIGKLPMPLSSPVAAILGDKLYVGGGSPGGGAVQDKMWVTDAP